MRKLTDDTLRRLYECHRNPAIDDAAFRRCAGPILGILLRARLGEHRLNRDLAAAVEREEQRRAGHQGCPMCAAWAKDAAERN